MKKKKKKKWGSDRTEVCMYGEVKAWSMKAQNSRKSINTEQRNNIKRNTIVNHTTQSLVQNTHTHTHISQVVKTGYISQRFSYITYLWLYISVSIIFQ